MHTGVVVSLLDGVSSNKGLLHASHGCRKISRPGTSEMESQMSVVEADACEWEACKGYACEGAACEGMRMISIEDRPRYIASARKNTV